MPTAPIPLPEDIETTLAGIAAQAELIALYERLAQLGRGMGQIVGNDDFELYAAEIHKTQNELASLVVDIGRRRIMETRR